MTDCISPMFRALKKNMSKAGWDYKAFMCFDENSKMSKLCLHLNSCLVLLCKTQVAHIQWG